jgi:hypothetical protein
MSKSKVWVSTNLLISTNDPGSSSAIPGPGRHFPLTLIFLLISPPEIRAFSSIRPTAEGARPGLLFVHACHLPLFILIGIPQEQ